MKIIVTVESETYQFEIDKSLRYDNVEIRGNSTDLMLAASSEAPVTVEFPDGQIRTANIETRDGRYYLTEAPQSAS